MDNTDTFDEESRCAAELQKTIRDDRLSVEDAVDLLRGTAGMTELHAKHRVLVTRGLIKPS